MGCRRSAYQYLVNDTPRSRLRQASQAPKAFYNRSTRHGPGRSTIHAGSQLGPNPYLMQDHAQASLVSHKLAAAVRQMQALRGTLVLANSNGLLSTWSFPGSLNSNLMLKWAPQLTALEVSGREVSIPGLAGFVAAASALQDVELSGLEDSEVAEAEAIFQGSTSIRSMSITGGHKIPCIWPLSTEKVAIQFEDMLDEQAPDRCAAEQLLLHGLLCSLMRLASLRTLYLDIDNMGSLQLRLVLPRLQVLSVTMWLDSAHAGIQDLSFSASQPCDVLDLNVQIEVSHPQLQVGLIDELQQQDIVLSRLAIVTHVPMPADILTQWKGICTDHLEEEHCKAGFGKSRLLKTLALIEDAFD